MEFLLDFLGVIVKAAICMGLLLHLAAFTIWVERKGSALIQDRVGANRCSIFGLSLAGIINTLVADPVKAITKEDFLPSNTNQLMHSLGPFLGIVPVIVSFAVVPFGPPLVVGDSTITMQLANLDVGILFLLAFGALSVYGVVMAAWVSSNKFSVLGGLRGSAQLISYEVTLGISLIAIIILYGTVDLNGIIAAQQDEGWGAFRFIYGFPVGPLALVLFFVSAMAETKRAPFDLPESESELVAGYMTEYSGMKFLLFWLGEFSEIVVASTMVVLLFFGGWDLPFVDLANFGEVAPVYEWSYGLFSFLGLPETGQVVGNFLYGTLGPIIAAHVFAFKVVLGIVLQIIIRWTLPRFRYDQLMGLCWKIMLPAALLNVAVTSVLVLL